MEITIFKKKFDVKMLLLIAAAAGLAVSLFCDIVNAFGYFTMSDGLLGKLGIWHWHYDFPNFEQFVGFVFDIRPVAIFLVYLLLFYDKPIGNWLVLGTYGVCALVSSWSALATIWNFFKNIILNDYRPGVNGVLMMLLSLCLTVLSAAAYLFLVANILFLKNNKLYGVIAVGVLAVVLLVSVLLGFINCIEAMVNTNISYFFVFIFHLVGHFGTLLCYAAYALHCWTHPMESLIKKDR